MKVARPRQCCGASWPHVSGSESILSPGSKIFSPALPITLLHGSPNFCRTTGRTSKPDRQNSDCIKRLQHWLVVVIFSRIRFLVPDTLVSNDVDAIMDFVSKAAPKKYIYKPFTPYMPPTGLITFTSEV